MAGGQAKGICKLLELLKVGSGAAVKGEKALECGVLLFLRVGVIGFEHAACLGVGVRLAGIEGAQFP